MKLITSDDIKNFLHQGEGQNLEIKSSDDTLKGVNDTVNDTVNGKNDTVNTANDTVKGTDDTVNDTVNGLKETQRIVLDEIFKNPSITYFELGKKLQKSRITIARAAEKFKNLGLISREGSDKTGHWVVNINIEKDSL